MTRILIIEDNATLSKLLKKDLELEGYEVHVAMDGETGLASARQIKPDLVILDLMLPKMNGYDICRTLRSEGKNFPILMLTAKGQPTEKVLGLNLGADDYVSKPFDSMELLARVRVLLRRPNRDNILDRAEFGNVVVDFRKMEVSNGDALITLTRKEFQILELLLRHRGEVVSRQRFFEEIWGTNEEISTRSIDVQVLTLRQKIRGSGKKVKEYIETVHGVGYKFVG